MGYVRGVSTERGSDGGIANGQVNKIANLFLGNIGKCLGTLLWTSPSLLRASQRKVTLKNRKEKTMIFFQEQPFVGSLVSVFPDGSQRERLVEAVIQVH